MQKMVEGVDFFQRKQKDLVLYVSDAFHRCDLLVLTSYVHMLVRFMEWLILRMGKSGQKFWNMNHNRHLLPCLSWL